MSKYKVNSFTYSDLKEVARKNDIIFAHEEQKKKDQEKKRIFDQKIEQLKEKLRWDFYHQNCLVAVHKWGGTTKAHSFVENLCNKLCDSAWAYYYFDVHKNGHVVYMPDFHKEIENIREIMNLR